MSDLDDLLEQEFPVADNYLYLNHAGVSPWPARTGAAVRQFAAQNVDMGARDYPVWVEAEQALRASLARLINAPSPDDIALLKNTSEALSFVAHGYPWKNGDNVVLSDEEFPSNRLVWESLATRGVTVRLVSLRDVADPETALLAAVDGQTRMLSVSTVQYASGLRMDLRRGFSREKLIGAFREVIEKNYPDLGPISDDMATFEAYFTRDAQAGDVILFTYLPGQGLTTELNGEAKGTITNLKFVEALWSVWFGAEPASKDMRADLAGAAR